MANRRRRHSAEFKQEAVRLVTEQGYSVVEAARSLGINENLLRTWKRKLSEDSDNGQATEDERQEL